MNRLSVDDCGGYSHWRFPRERKYSQAGVVRGVPPDVTIARAEKALDRGGLTTVADITRLHRVGIPNYMSVRPRDADPGITYYNGKGLTTADAGLHCGKRGLDTEPLQPIKDFLRDGSIDPHAAESDAVIYRFGAECAAADISLRIAALAGVLDMHASATAGASE